MSASKVRSPERRVTRIRNRSERRIKRWRQELERRIRRERSERRRRIEKIRASLSATNITEKLVKFVASFEGFVDHAYKPVASETYYTIGYGHYGADVKAGDTITKAKALKLLDDDLASFVRGVRDALTRDATQQQFDAMVSFAFNVGLGNFADSTLLRKFNAGDLDGAADEFERWVYGAGGERLEGLERRRAAERTIFVRGVYNNN